MRDTQTGAVLGQIEAPDDNCEVFSAREIRLLRTKIDKLQRQLTRAMIGLRDVEEHYIAILADPRYADAWKSVAAIAHHTRKDVEGME